MSVGSFTLLVNPQAAAGRAKGHVKVIESVLRRAGVEFNTVETKRATHSTELTREALDGGTAGIACVGGDGTLHEVVNGFFDEDGLPIAKESWLAPLPCGTGGDFRRTLGIPQDPEAMTERMIHARPTEIDVGRLSSTREGKIERRMFINIASFGLSGKVIRRVNRSPKWLGGRATFALATALSAATYRPERVRFWVDDEDEGEHEVVTAAVANGRYFGGGMMVAPLAKLNGGTLELVILPPQSRWEQLRYAPRLYSGEVLSVPRVIRLSGKNIRVESVDESEPVLIDADGEAAGTLPATFQVHENALRLRA